MTGATITASDGERAGSTGSDESTTVPAYGFDHIETRHPGEARAVPDGGVVAVAVAVGVAIWSGSPQFAAVVAMITTVWFRSLRLVLLAVLLAVVGSMRSDQAWTGLAPDEVGPFAGWVTMVTDPQPYGRSTRLIIEIEGERFESWIRGTARQQRVREWRGGQQVMVSGTRHELDHERADRVAWQHVVGEFDLEWASDVGPGTPVARASNRVRATIESGASALRFPYDALFRGLVIGDDRDQPPDMIERFRASGLSHLTAVSGQNVAFLLAACAPLLVRMRPIMRWAVTLGLIAWFVTLTRFEPSIVRAGTMAALSASAYLTGRERGAVRLLALAVIGLVLVDPLLVWSIGFWLSVGATAGVCVCGPVFATLLRRCGALATPLGVTLGAQIGVALPVLLVFGRLPLASVPANLLAVPVAGAVMLYGVPAALVAGWVPAVSGALMLPAQLGCRWVDTIAHLGARLEPPAPWNVVGWVVIIVAMLAVVVQATRRGKNPDRHDDASAHR